MEDFILDPTTPIDITISISATVRPYLQQWFSETKNTNESISDFVIRRLLTQAFVYRSNKLTDDFQSGVRAYIEANFPIE